MQINWKKLLLTPTGKRNIFEHADDWWIKFDDKIQTVKKGSLTDGASIPRILWVHLTPWDNYPHATGSHDDFYASDDPHLIKINEDGTQEKIKVTRKLADDLFLEIMKKEKVNFFKRRLIYSAVRVASWAFWKGK